MTNIAHLLVMTIDLTSETWYELDNSAPDHHAVLYNSGIHAVLAEISHTSHLGPGRPCWPYPRTWWVGRVCRADYGTQDPTPRHPATPHGPARAVGCRGSLVIAFNMVYSDARQRTTVSGFGRRLPVEVQLKCSRDTALAKVETSSRVANCS